MNFLLPFLDYLSCFFIKKKRREKTKTVHIILYSLFQDFYLKIHFKLRQRCLPRALTSEFSVGADSEKDESVECVTESGAMLAKQIMTDVDDAENESIKCAAESDDHVRVTRISLINDHFCLTMSTSGPHF